ncbi:Putative Conidiation-specific protein 10 [Rhizopus microsporus]|nr:Putative Conidiation-specific protein 10 [Rhizopus microsporus]
MSSQNSNPGNFANRPKEEIRNIASKGGQYGHVNKDFASMDPDKQHEIASRVRQSSRSGGFVSMDPNK